MAPNLICPKLKRSVFVFPNKFGTWQRRDSVWMMATLALALGKHMIRLEGRKDLGNLWQGEGFMGWEGPGSCSEVEFFWTRHFRAFQAFGIFRILSGFQARLSGSFRAPFGLLQGLKA